MAQGDGIFQYKHITASAVVAGSNTAGQNTGGPQAVLHAVTINSAAATATIQVYDYNTTTSPPASNAITGPITAPTGGITNPITLLFDCMVYTGIVVIIGVAAADVTVVYR